MTTEWLRTGMFGGESDSDAKIGRIIEELGDHAVTKSHARHLSMERCRQMGLQVVALESNQELQDAVLSLHHACMLTFSATPATKIIENQMGVAFIKMVQEFAIAGQAVSKQQLEEALMLRSDRE